MKKSNTTPQLHELPGRQWIVLVGPELGESKQSCRPMRLNIVIPYAENPAIDEFLLAKKATELAKALQVATGNDSIRMIALVTLGFTVPDCWPTVWKLNILVDLPNAISECSFNEQAAKHLETYKPTSHSRVSWVTEVDALLDGTWVPPNSRPSILAGVFQCILGDVKKANDELVEVDRNRRRMRAKMS